MCSQGSLKYPRGIATNRRGELVVVDCHSRRVTVHDPRAGDVTLSMEGKGDDGLELFTDPYYVAVNPTGQMIITDWAAPNIKIFTAQGKVATKYGTYGSKKDQVQTYINTEHILLIGIDTNTIDTCICVCIITCIYYSRSCSPMAWWQTSLVTSSWPTTRTTESTFSPRTESSSDSS